MVPDPSVIEVNESDGSPTIVEGFIITIPSISVVVADSSITNPNLFNIPANICPELPTPIPNPPDKDHVKGSSGKVTVPSGLIEIPS